MIGDEYQAVIGGPANFIDYLKRPENECIKNAVDFVNYWVCENSVPEYVGWVKPFLMYILDDYEMNEIMLKTMLT